MGKVDLAGKLNDARARMESEMVEASQRDLPKFAQLTRKDARVREDQYAALSGLARTLMRRRTVKDERITENTLIRVAIDLLLAHQDDLRGGTEDELRESVTSALPKFGNSAGAHSGTGGHPISGRSELSKVGRAGRPDFAAPYGMPGSSPEASVPVRAASTAAGIV